MIIFTAKAIKERLCDVLLIYGEVNISANALIIIPR